MAGAIGNAGVILAGGRSSRMGANKAEMLFAGEPMARRVLRRLTAAVDEVLIIGPETLRTAIPQARIVADIVPAIGPLGGLYTALRATSCDRIFLVACDMPFVQPGLVRAMLALAEANEAADAVVLPGGQHIQPLHAVYSRNCLPAVEQALASGDHALHSLLAHLSILFPDEEIVRREDPHGLSALNVNTPEEWQRALRLVAVL